MAESVRGKKSEPMKIVIENGYLGDCDKERIVYVQDVGGTKTLDLYSGMTGQEEGGPNDKKDSNVPVHRTPSCCDLLKDYSHQLHTQQITACIHPAGTYVQKLGCLWSNKYIPLQLAV